MLSVSMIALAATMVSCSKDDNGGNGGNGGNNKPEPETWAGTWEITSSQTLTWEEAGQYVEPAFSNTEKTGTLIIVEDTDGYMIYGLSPDFDAMLTEIMKEPYSIPALGEENANGELEIMSGYTPLGGADENGDYFAWAVVSDNNYTITGIFPAYTFELVGETTGIPYSGTLTDGTNFTVASIDIYGLNESTNGVGIYTTESYAGDITLTFVSDEVSASTASKAALSTLNPDFKMVYPAKVAKVAVAR